MQRRKLGHDLEVSALGLGCMGMSEFYGPRDDEQALHLLDQAIGMGVDFLDTADMYGPHHNEELIGRFLATRKPKVQIASKFGIVRRPGEYRRSIDNSPDYARKCCDASLRRLGVEQIDLYYVHRIDPAQAIEETMEGLARLVQQGKVARVGLCEVSAATLRRAHAVHPVAAVQTEYSLWTRDVETEVLPTCRELGIGLVAYSPLGRGFLTGRFQQDATSRKATSAPACRVFSQRTSPPTVPWSMSFHPSPCARHARRHKSLWHGYWLKAMTSCLFLVRGASRICRTTWARYRYAWSQRIWLNWGVPSMQCQSQATAIPQKE